MPRKKPREIIIAHAIQGELWDAVMEGVTATTIEMEYFIPELKKETYLRGILRPLLLSFLSHLIIDGFVTVPNKKKK